MTTPVRKKVRDHTRGAKDILAAIERSPKLREAIETAVRVGFNGHLRKENVVLKLRCRRLRLALDESYKRGFDAGRLAGIVEKGLLPKKTE